MTKQHSRLGHSPASLFVLSTKSTGVVAAAAVGLAVAARPYGATLSHSGLLLSLGGLQCGWLGANLAISFLEAPVKFLAPTPARRSLIDVGRHVFSALNKVEVTLAAFDILGWYLVTQRGLVAEGEGILNEFLGRGRWFRFIPGLIVYVFQSFTFLPVMRNVGARYIEGQPTVESARTHVVYVALELIKVIALGISTAGIARTLVQKLQ
ncbi:hypothetical protein BGZ65_002838 [Modicella reniformis]|uniref:Uncharacterized protein n=1 Tax=Modicella reniformis TaxID=1440133 RepID=A0A9P6SMD6_9FUNG|nr:hypothetical protein BGZ65_002838 [Modicella reniformis]